MVSTVNLRSEPEQPAARLRSVATTIAARVDGMVNAMSVDVEEYFQVSAFANQVSPADWDRMPSRIERTTDAVLALFADLGGHATFFTLGWIAERYPRLIRRIREAGHEIASHGFAHTRVDRQSPDAFRADVRRTKALLEDVAGTAVKGYRAASFSIGERTPWAFEVLAEEGHLYSSSVYPIRHDHYGMPNAPRFAFAPCQGSDFREIPVSTVALGSWTLPCGGGGYFRLLPYALMSRALRRINQHDRRPGVFYFHPWEIDPAQPRIAGAGARARFRHYTNLSRMEPKLREVLGDFRWDRMDRVFLGGGPTPT